MLTKTFRLAVGCCWLSIWTLFKRLIYKGRHASLYMTYSSKNIYCTVASAVTILVNFKALWLLLMALTPYLCSTYLVKCTLIKCTVERCSAVKCTARKMQCWKNVCWTGRCVVDAHLCHLCHPFSEAQRDCQPHAQQRHNQQCRQHYHRHCRQRHDQYDHRHLAPTSDQGDYQIN